MLLQSRNCSLNFNSANCGAFRCSQYSFKRLSHPHTAPPPHLSVSSGGSGCVRGLDTLSVRLRSFTRAARESPPPRFKAAIRASERRSCLSLNRSFLSAFGSSCCPTQLHSAPPDSPPPTTTALSTACRAHTAASGARPSGTLSSPPCRH